MKCKRIVYADLLVLLGLALFTSWYLYQAWSASSKIENLIFILPVAAITLLLCAFEAIKQLGSKTVNQAENEEQQESVLSVLPVMGLFAAYVLTLEWLGFDLGTVLFIAAFLLIQGERRPAWLVAYSLVFGALVALFFSNMLPYPMPMTFIATEY